MNMKIEQERMRNAKLEQLREDISAGVDSGSAGAWQPDQVKQDGRARRAASAANPLLARITIEPGKRGWRPCLRSMRIAVKDVLELLSNGASHAEILEHFPDLQEDDIRAALAWAAAHAST